MVGVCCCSILRAGGEGGEGGAAVVGVGAACDAAGGAGGVGVGTVREDGGHFSFSPQMTVGGWGECIVARSGTSSLSAPRCFTWLSTLQRLIDD